MDLILFYKRCQEQFDIEPYALAKQTEDYRRYMQGFADGSQDAEAKKIAEHLKTCAHFFRRLNQRLNEEHREVYGVDYSENTGEIR